MHGPTCIFGANLTPPSHQLLDGFEAAISSSVYLNWYHPHGGGSYPSSRPPEYWFLGAKKFLLLWIPIENISRARVTFPGAWIARGAQVATKMSARSRP
jgi:hypothetical protein